MPAKPPEGQPAPVDGVLPAQARAGVGTRPFGVYLHVPYCATRCGYCDFNTYTPADPGGHAGMAGFGAAVAAELAIARRVLGDAELPVETVFVGGGTPTLLAPEELGRLLTMIDDTFGLAPGAEVTTEANPESVDAAALERLVAAGYTRVSFGMQSARPHVLAALDRHHTPGRVPDVVDGARKAGFGGISLDLIYGAPGESEADWRASLDAVVDLAPDHVSAYALVVEEGTRLARRIRRGELLPPDDDTLADRYLVADATLAAAGYEWYEISNWAARPAARCRHNVGYWRSHDWWGLGPGAHSHVGGVRWWNVRHPAPYADLVVEGASPAAAREVLDDETRRTERVMLSLRLVDGLATSELTAAGAAAAGRAAADGRLDPAALADGRAVLTLRGRLLADAVVADLLPD